MYFREMFLNKHRVVIHAWSCQLKHYHVLCTAIKICWIVKTSLQSCKSCQTNLITAPLTNPRSPVYQFLRNVLGAVLHNLHSKYVYAYLYVCKNPESCCVSTTYCSALSRTLWLWELSTQCFPLCSPPIFLYRCRLDQNDRNFKEYNTPDKSSLTWRLLRGCTILIRLNKVKSWYGAGV